MTFSAIHAVGSDKTSSRDDGDETMLFELDDEHKALQAMVRDFVDQEVAPRARHVDETGEYPWDTLRKMALQW